METVGIVDSVSAVDQLTARLTQWASLASKDSVEPQSMPYQVWVGGSRVQEMPKSGMSDSGSTGDNGGRDQVSPQGTFMQFVIDNDSKITVKIVDQASGEVVRTIPPEELAKYAHESGMTPGRIVETLL